MELVNSNCPKLKIGSADMEIFKAMIG